MMTQERRWHWVQAALPPLLLVATALAIGGYRMGDTGPLWPDEPRYTNGAAMICDWVRSGEWLHPYGFAKENYARYPGFSMPFHPPGCPSILAGCFLAAGMSYEMTRLGAALCAGVLACLFYALLRRGTLDRFPAFLCALLLLTTPEIALWSRGAMSEIPSMAVMMGAALLFWRWFETGRPQWSWLAFAVAECAFLCRVTTIGILPGWLLFVLVMGQWRRLRSWHVVVPAIIYLALSIGYVRFAAHFARYEVAADGKGALWLWSNLSYFAVLQPMLCWGTTLLAIPGAIWCLRLARRFPVGLFFLCWFVGYAAFKLLTPTTPELRHFFGALPGLAALPASLFLPKRAWRTIAVPLVFALAIALNAWSFAGFPRGLVGYGDVGRYLAAQSTPGNILMCCWDDQDLIFRYRTFAPDDSRIMIRGDRTLVIRLPEYARQKTVQQVANKQELLDVIRRGRVRYVVTGVTPNASLREKFPEIAFAHDAIRSSPELFRLHKTFPLVIQYGRPGYTGEIYVWEYLGDLPPGPSELNIHIPTANMTLPHP